jgi:hypothetical protein
MNEAIIAITFNFYKIKQTTLTKSIFTIIISAKIGP